MSPSRPLPIRPTAWKARLRRLIREACITDPRGVAATGPTSSGPFWELTPTPLVIPAEEWARLETGLRQRARLINALMVDIYDRQALLHQGLVPPEAILGDPYYRRPCLHLEPGRKTPANLLRFDLVRTAAGWQVTQTRVNTPAGLSYAVQNRRFMYQEAADLYSRMPDHHSIINFPLQLLASLRRIAPPGIASPTIVMLTSGPHDPFYNEHSFLARKMGVPLARGDDFLVLDNRVYFKTIAGLERVDVIYRRLNTAHIDPVVFETSHETAGIPGLVQCIRAGTVVVSNAIGVGVAESRALEVWLPRLMRFYLGEKPLLPGIPTYTCGDIDQLDHILSRLSSLEIRPIHDPRLGDPRVHQPATYQRRNRLVKEVLENPFGFVGQETPASQGINLRPSRAAPFQFSAFVLADDRQFTVFPGGLVRIGPGLPPLDRVGVTADAVVLMRAADSAAGEPGSPDQEEPSLPPPRQPLGSHAAESLFWLGRYLERADTTARMLALIEDVSLEEIPTGEKRQWTALWQGLLEATGHGTHPTVTPRRQPLRAGEEGLSWPLTLDAHNPSSIYSSVSGAIYNARKLRDFVSPEAWSILHHLHERLESLRRGSRRSLRQLQARSAISAALQAVNGFLGTARRTMLHDAGWHFLVVGESLERAATTCSAVGHVLGEGGSPFRSAAVSGNGGDSPVLSALLRMLGSQDAYRRLYRARSQPHLVADFFLRQPEAPRSLVHSLRRIELAMAAIHPDGGSDPVAPAVRRLLEQVRELFPAPAPATAPETFAEFLTLLLPEIEALHPLLSDFYFTHHARVCPVPA